MSSLHMYVPRGSLCSKRVPVDHLYTGHYPPWSRSLAPREASAILNQALELADVDDDADDESSDAAGKCNIGVVGRRNAASSQTSASVSSRVIVARQVRRSQSQVLQPRRLSARMMSGKRASADDLDLLEIEARRRRRRSVYYDHQRAGPSQSVKAIPSVPSRKDIVSTDDYWRNLDLDGKKSPSSAAGHSEASSGLQRVREKLKWQSLRTVFRF